MGESMRCLIPCAPFPGHHAPSPARRPPLEPQAQRILASGRAHRAHPAVSGTLGAQTTAVKRQMNRPDPQERRRAAQARRRPSRPRSTDQDSGGAGPGLGREEAIPTCASSFRITAGSCSVAISRSWPPQCGHARTSSANARCINAAHLEACEPLFAFVPSAPATRDGASGASRPYAATRAHPAGTSPRCNPLHRTKVLFPRSMASLV